MSRSRVLAWLGAAALLTLPVSVSGVAEAAPPARATVAANGDTKTSARAAGSTRRIRVATFNVRAGVSAATFKRALRELVPRADVIGLQEINSHDKEDVLGSLAGWGYYRPARFFGEQNPVVWNRNRFRLVGARSVKTSPATYIGNESPAKGSTMGEHFVSVVRLRDLATGEAFSVVNVHLPPGAVRGGRPAPDKPRLFARFVSELAATVQVVDAEDERGRVFTTGDFNAGWVEDRKHLHQRLPIRTFGRADLVSMWATERPRRRIGTHNDSLIDQVFSDGRALNAVVARDIKGSDHFPAVATYPAT
jgi:endonuclease/exonuclease/phosphatase (EEP) superfamily protein YafD